MLENNALLPLWGNRAWLVSLAEFAWSRATSQV